MRRESIVKEVFVLIMLGIKRLENLEDDEIVILSI